MKWLVTRWLKKHRNKYLLRRYEGRYPGYNQDAYSPQDMTVGQMQRSIYNLRQRSDYYSEYSDMKEANDKLRAEADYYEGLYRKALEHVVACEKKHGV